MRTAVLSALILVSATWLPAATTSCSSAGTFQDLVNFSSGGSSGFSGCTISYNNVTYTFDYFQFQNSTAQNTSAVTASNVVTSTLNTSGVGFNFYKAGGMQTSQVMSVGGSSAYSFDLVYAMVGVTSGTAINGETVTASGVLTAGDAAVNYLTQLTSRPGGAAMGSAVNLSQTYATFMPTNLNGTNSFNASSSFNIVTHFSLNSGTQFGSSASTSQVTVSFSPTAFSGGGPVGPPTGAPEPATWSLLIPALGALAWWKRRRA